MCYDIKTKLEAQLKRAVHYGDRDYIEALKKKISVYGVTDWYHVSAFAHPNVLIYTNENPYQPIPATWGLVPHWIADDNQRLKLWNNTVNARGETIFEKASFKTSAEKKRCLIYLDGFYEHHHYQGKTYPFYIQRKDQQPFAVAGLWDEWINQQTGEQLTSFSIVTTKANQLMAKIHNNPKIEEPRMPVILKPEKEDEWLMPIGKKEDRLKIEQLIIPYPGNELTAYTVSKLRGKNVPENVPEASDEVIYEELVVA